MAPVSSSIVIGLSTVLIGILFAGFGALWKLANSLRDRPTYKYIDGKFDDIQDDVGEIKIENAKQGVTLSNIESQVKRLNKRAETQPAVNSQ